jgi:uncharacterized membrane protein YccC
MAQISLWKWSRPDRKEFKHVALTAVASVASLLIARLCRLPESYWAPITTIVIMQSTLGAAWTISKQRLAGTAIGAALGALLAGHFGPNALIFGLGMFVSGAICALLRLERNAYRYTGITLAIIFLVERTQAAWIIAVHRFIEIAIGIAVGLALTALFPEDQPATA